MNKKIIILFFVLVITAPHAFAALGNYEPSHWTERDTYTEKAIGKLGFGVKNALLGWTELIYHPYAAGSKGENIVEGAIIGLWYGLADTAGGILHFATFPIPFDIKLPEGGTHMFGEVPI